LLRQTYASQQQLQNSFTQSLVDGTMERLGITTQTNRLRLHVQQQLSKPARNAINIASVSGTKAQSTLTRAQISAYLTMVEEG